MTVVIQIISLSSGLFDGTEGLYVQEMDVDAHEGRGLMTVTDDPSKALQFADSAEALEYWNTPSKVVPFRPDGRPNKPLTAYSVTIADPNDTPDAS